MRSRSMESFFLECQNFDRSRLDLLAASIPIKPRVGLNDCHQILTNRLLHDDKGILYIGYHQYREGVPYMVTDKSLKEDKNVARESFLLRKKSLIEDIDIRYMSSFSYLRQSGDICSRTKSPFHMNKKTS